MPIPPRSRNAPCAAPPRPPALPWATAAAPSPPPPKGTNVKLYTDADPMADAAFPVKIDLLREIDAYARALDPRVVQVSATISAGLQEVEILRPEGLRLSDIRPMARMNISVIVEENGRREQGGMGGGGRYGLARLMEPAHWQATGARGAADRGGESRRGGGPGGHDGRACSAPAGPASFCTRRSVTASRATSTARRPRPSRGFWASASPRPA